MPARAKPTFPPIFPRGLTEVATGDLAQIFSDPAFDTPLRRRLTADLRLFIAELDGLGAHGELWINGSYATKKPEPADMDVALCIPLTVVSAMSNAQLDRLDFLSDVENRPYVRSKWHVDFYVFEASDIASRTYYFELFSRNPDQFNPKGIPFIRL